MLDAWHMCQSGPLTRRFDKPLGRTLLKVRDLRQTERNGLRVSFLCNHWMHIDYLLGIMSSVLGTGDMKVNGIDTVSLHTKKEVTTLMEWLKWPQSLPPTVPLISWAKSPPSAPASRNSHPAHLPAPTLSFLLLLLNTAAEASFENTSQSPYSAQLASHDGLLAAWKSKC